jgi:hypothetical protein
MFVPINFEASLNSILTGQPAQFYFMPLGGAGHASTFVTYFTLKLASIKLTIVQ